MKRAGFLLVGLLSAMVIAGTACGGAKETAKPTPTRAAAAATPTRPAAVATPTPTRPPAAAVPTAAPAPGAVLDIGSVASEEFKFGEAGLSAKAGAQVTLRFKNNAKVNQHNWVLVKSGTKDQVATRGTAAAATGWVAPGDPDVIASTKLADPGKTSEVTFTVPAAGTYQFVCTFPAHAVTMFGEFKVTQ